MATLDSSNIVNNNVIQTNDLLQLYDALNYVGASPQYLVSISGSLLGTASYCTTASFALNGGGGGGAVTQIIQGSNITITSTGPSGTGDVTITSTAGGGGGGFPYTASTPAVISGSLIITGSNLGPDLIVTGSVFATQGFTGSLSLVDTAETASFNTTAQTASYALIAQTASFNATSVNSLNSILSDTSSKVTVLNNNSSITYLPLIFGTSSAAGTQQLNIDTNPGGPLYNPSLKSISASSFTGSLLGTASNNDNSQYSLTANTSSFINTAGFIGNFTYYPTFVFQSSTPILLVSPISTSLGLTINSFNGLLIATTLSSSAITASSIAATTLSSSAITASSITSSFTGSLRGTSSWSTAATQIQTVGISTNASHYLTFVDANNATATEESLYTDSNISFNPSTNLLSVTGSITSSFTGSLLGTSSNANTASYANTASVPNTTTQWTSIGYSTTTYPIPAGRDVGVVFTFTNTGYRTFGLNTASALIGDQVQIATVGTYANGGLMKITTTGSSAVSGTILVAGLSPNPNTNSNVSQTAWSPATNSGSQASWKFVCVKSSSKPIWQLVSYMDRALATQVMTYLDVLEIS